MAEQKELPLFERLSTSKDTTRVPAEFIPKYAAFDLEAASPIATGQKYTAAHGLACGALAIYQGLDPLLGHVRHSIRLYEPDPSSPGAEKMNDATVRKIVFDLHKLCMDGYRILTWAGTGFDFQALSLQAGSVSDWVRFLALTHYDLFMQVFCIKGYAPGLDKAALGMGLEGKTHEVKLSSGEVITDMAGGRAPVLWQAGERSAVIEYLKGDVVQLLQLAYELEAQRLLKWTSTKGRSMSVLLPRLMTVSESLQIERPDMSWAKDPLQREFFTDWLWAEKEKAING